MAFKTSISIHLHFLLIHVSLKLLDADTFLQFFLCKYLSSNNVTSFPFAKDLLLLQFGFALFHKILYIKTNVIIFINQTLLVPIFEKLFVYIFLELNTNALSDWFHGVTPGCNIVKLDFCFSCCMKGFWNHFRCITDKSTPDSLVKFPRRIHWSNVALHVHTNTKIYATPSLRKKCPYSELYLSVFSPNAGKCGPE